jgi:hypothetical protein
MSFVRLARVDHRQHGAAQSHTAAHRPRGEGARQKVFTQGE